MTPNRVARLITSGLVLLAVMATAVIVTAQDDTQAKIDSAMSAAPAPIAQEATILDNEVDADGNPVVLREGTNGWTCFPDGPGTPGPDPMCLDEVWMQWLAALIAGEEPNTTKLGLAYMLAGGSDASNSDPAALEPPEGEEWMTSPPHTMVILPSDVDISSYGTDPDSGGPWVMWAGTPYQHIMVPIAVMAEMAP